MDDVELKEICNHFAEHYAELIELQSAPPKFMTERYITKLTSLVILSDTLTKDQKHQFYRNSYEQSLEARKNGVEWKWLLGMLVERTDALTLDELQDLTRTTSHEPLKPLIQKAMDRIEKTPNNRPSVESSVKDDGINNSSTEQSSSHDEYSKRYYWFISGLFLMVVALLLRVLKRKTPTGLP